MAKFVQGRYNMKIPTSTLAVKHLVQEQLGICVHEIPVMKVPRFKKWASESTYSYTFLHGKFTIYVPDFFIAYDKNGNNT